MTPAILVPAGKSLVEAVLPLLRHEGRDYSGNTVIFQGKRPGHFLRKALARDAGGSILPPRILPIDAFVDTVHRVLTGGVSADLEPFDAVELLYALQEDGSPGPWPEERLPLEAFLASGTDLYRAVEELHEAGIPADRVLAENPALGAVYGAFYERVARLGRSTRAMRYRQVAAGIEACDLTQFGSIIVAGFFGFAPGERDVMSVLRRRTHAVFVFQEGPGLQERLQAHGFTTHSSRVDVVPPATSITRAPDTHGEVAATAARVRTLVEGGSAPAEETVIVLPSADALFPVHEWLLPELGTLPHNISLGYPLDRTPVRGFVDAFLGLVSSFEGGRIGAAAYLAFVLHPYTKNLRWMGRSDLTRITFQTVEEHLAAHSALTTFDPAMLESDQSLLRRVASRLAGVRTGIGASDVGDHLKTIHDRTIRLFLRTTSVGDAAGKLIDILNFVHEESTARLHPLFRPFVVAALEQLEALRRSRLGARVLEGATAYAAMIRAALAGTSVPFPGTPLRGVQVLGFLETRNLTFERVFVLDANEGVLPPRTDIDVFLPPETRAHLGLPDLREREDAGVYYFHQLAAGARELHVYYREGGKSERSRIVEKMVWDRQQRAGTLEERPFIGTVVRQANLVQSLPGALPKPPEVLPRLRGLTFSATMLDTYLSCPVRFAYRYLYGLEEREVVEEEVGRDDIGRLVHAILADFWRPAVGRTLVRSDADPSRLEAILDAKFTEQFGPEVGGARHLIRRQMERQLHAAVERYHGEVCAEGGVTLLGVEVRMEAEAGGHRFRGVADRIERRGETVHILDYKTGGNAGSRLIDFTSLNPSDASTWAGSIGSLQLPLYTLLYARTEGVAAERIVPAYVLLGRKTVGRKSEVRLYAEGDPVGAYHAMAEAAILAIVDQIVDPARPFEPTARPEKECAGCAFATICGTTWADR